MKTDRLLGITMYLLNRDTVPARELAQRFEVSVRTIVRDVQALGLAGIPVASSTGVSGGYRIIDTFGISKPAATRDDFKLMITALGGLCSAYNSKEASETLEKLKAAGQSFGAEQKVFIDFSVVREGEDTAGQLALIEAAIENGTRLELEYSDAAGNSSVRAVEPVALNFRWYAWYLLAFCLEKQDYRLFKLTRVTALKSTDESFVAQHGAARELLERHWGLDDRRELEITLLCRADIRNAAKEYLKGRIVEERENGDFVMVIDAPEGERMWFSLLMGFGSAVKVLSPKEVADNIADTARQILL